MLIRGRPVVTRDTLGSLAFVGVMLGGLWGAAALDAWDARREEEHQVRWQEHLRQQQCESTVADEGVHGWQCNDGTYFATNGQVPLRFGAYDFAH